MSDVRKALVDFSCASAVRSAAVALVPAAPSTHLWEGTSDDYVGLCGSGDSAIGVYVNHNRLSIALDPASAQSAAAKYTLPTEKKGATSYVLLDADRLGDAGTRAVAVQLGLQALEQSCAKPAKKPKPHTKSTEKPDLTCPKHHYTLLPNGTCWACQPG